MTAARDDLARALLDARAELAQSRADAQAAVALVVEQAAEEVDRHYAAGDMGNPGHWVRALADADGLAAVEALRKERDRFEAALARACLVGGTTYLVERAEKAEAELAAAQQREAGLLAAIEEATDPDFILGAMDNVNDMDVTLDGFAQAASRAIRAALAHNGRGE